MKAALYARYSTAMQSEASIADQLRVCERLAERHGFEVVARFSDAAISGGTASRPAYQRMMAAARRRDFDVIVAEDTSRLWRNMAEQSPRLAELADLGVQVVTHDHDSREESAEMMGAVTGAMAANYRKEIGRRTRRGLEGLARSGKSAGGRAYGYQSATDSGTDQREIEEDQAAIVRRIFQMYADGASAKMIAATLNAEGIPSPGSSWARKSRRKSGWLSSAIAGDPTHGTGILNNDQYRGVVIWNRRRWARSAVDSARRRPLLNPRSAWIELREERLRIVTDDLWSRVKARQRERSAGIGDQIKAGRSRRQAASGRAPRYLFSGWLVCGECGAKFTLVNARSYGCASYINGRACANSIHVRRDLVESRLLAGVQESLSSPKVAAEIERRVRKALATERARKPDTKRMAALSVEIENLATAIASGGLRGSPALARRLMETENELQELAAMPPPRPIPLMTDIGKRIRASLARLPAILAEDPERARMALQDVLGPEITLRPASDGGYLEAEFGVEVSPLAVGLSEKMVAGVGFEPTTFGL